MGWFSSLLPDEKGFAGHALFSLLSRLAVTAISFGSGIILSRLLGAEGLGRYSYTMAVVMLIAVPAVRGVPTLLVRFVSSYYSSGEMGLLKGLLRRSLQGAAAYSFIATAAGLVLARTGDTMAIGVPLVPLVALVGICGAFLRSTGRMKLGIAVEAMLRPLSFFAILLVGYVIFRARAQATSVMAAQVAATAATALIGLIFLLRHVPRGLREAECRFDIPAWSRALLPLLLTAGIQVAGRSLGTILVGIYLGPEGVGVFRVALRGGELVEAVEIAMASVIGTSIARRYSQKQFRELQSVLTRGTRLVAAVSLTLGVTLLLSAGWVLPNVFGRDFAGGLIALRIVTVGRILVSFGGPAGLLCTMTGHERQMMLAGLWGTLGFIGMCVVLIPLYGVNGAALAYVLRTVVIRFLLVSFGTRKIRLDSTVLGVLGRREGK